MKKFLLVALAIVGVLAILAAMLAIGLFAMFAILGSEPAVPSRTILEIDFQRGVVEALPDDPFADFMGPSLLAVRDIVDALDRGAGDRRVQGLVARVGSAPMSLAHIQEIRDAVQRFRAAGKPAIAFSETFGEFGPGNGAYYLATAFDEIYLQPSGDVGLTGLIYNTMFIRGLLEKLEVEPRMDQRYEYKNAMNMYTETGYTGPHREAMQALVDSQFEQIVQGIALGRGIEEQQVRDLVDAGPYLALDALEAGLVDGLEYRESVYGLMRERIGSRARRLFIGPYLDRAGRPNARGTTVALIQGFGAVTRGASAYSSLSGQSSMGSDTIAGSLRQAIDNPKVKAIILRVDSPGGSYVASDTIWRETLRAQEAGKPVIVTMGSLAASGGYFVAMHADKIVAQPGTITGSIGVLGGKMLTTKLWGKVGVSWDEVHAGRNSGMYDSGQDYDEQGYGSFQAGLDRIYQDFTEKVADGRGLPLERVQEIARGRIWTGAAAKEIGLVDELGGYETALRLTRAELGLAADDPIRIRVYPRARTPLEALFPGEPERSTSLQGVAASLREVRPLFRALEQVTSDPDAAVLSAPDPGPVH